MRPFLVCFKRLLELLDLMKDKRRSSEEIRSSEELRSEAKQCIALTVQKEGLVIKMNNRLI